MGNEPFYPPDSSLPRLTDLPARFGEWTAIPDDGASVSSDPDDVGIVRGAPDMPCRRAAVTGAGVYLASRAPDGGVVVAFFQTDGRRMTGPDLMGIGPGSLTQAEIDGGYTITTVPPSISSVAVEPGDGGRRQLPLDFAAGMAVAHCRILRESAALVGTAELASHMQATVNPDGSATMLSRHGGPTGKVGCHPEVAARHEHTKPAKGVSGTG